MRNKGFFWFLTILLTAICVYQLSFTWVSNGRKLMNVPFDENPYSAFAAFLKTDEGVEIYKSIDKKL